MAIYLELPVYKACYELYLKFVKVRRTLPREERYTIGQELDRTYVSSRSLRRIRNHLHVVTPRMHMQRAQAVVNSSLGVLSHYDSFCLRKVLVAKSRLSGIGRISDDGLRFYPNVLDWERSNLEGKK